MAITQNTFTGDGSTVLFSFTFPYLDESHIKVSLNGSDTILYTLANATTIQMNTAPSNGVAVRVYRNTDSTALEAQFFSGSSIRAQDLNDNFTQILFKAQETENFAASTDSSAIAGTAAGAVSTANTALSVANTANTTANGIAATANTALSNSTAAVTTANAANALAAAAVPSGVGAIVNADINASAAIVDTKLATIATAGKVSNSATTATDANTASTIVARSASGNFNTTSINGGALAGTRNHIINGEMLVPQRGTSFPVLVSTYTLDRWVWGQTGAMVCTVSQSSDVPNNTFQTSCKIDVTTADPFSVSANYAVFEQRIEGVNARDLVGTTFTLSFWVKSPKTGIHCIGFRNLGSNSPDRSYVKEYTITASNVWEYKTITLAGGLITDGNWNWTNGGGLSVVFTLGSGATHMTTANAWQTGNSFATANQVNVLDNTANDFFITGVQLEPGSVATPFERRPYGAELALCQRYYQKTGANWVVESNSICQSKYHMVRMRSTPTVTGGGAGYTYLGDGSIITEYQTSRAFQALIYSAEF
jgi:hypothetical protein